MKHRKNYTIIHKETGVKFDFFRLLGLIQSGNNELHVSIALGVLPNSDNLATRVYSYRVLDVFICSDFIHLPFLLKNGQYRGGEETTLFLEQFEHQGNMALEDLNDLLRIEHENKSE